MMESPAHLLRVYKQAKPDGWICCLFQSLNLAVTVVFSFWYSMSLKELLIDRLNCVSFWKLCFFHLVVILWSGRRIPLIPSPLRACPWDNGSSSRLSSWLLVSLCPSLTFSCSNALKNHLRPNPQHIIMLSKWFVRIRCLSHSVFTPGYRLFLKQVLQV